MMKEQLCTTVGMVGGFIAALLGGWDTGLQTLMILIGIDYLTGLIVAGVFHKSTKTKTERWKARRDSKDSAEKP